MRLLTREAVENEGANSEQPINKGQLIILSLIEFLLTTLLRLKYYCIFKSDISTLKYFKAMF